MVKNKILLSVWLLVSLFAGFSVVGLHGQQNLSSELRLNGKIVLGAFEKQRAVIQKSSAVIYQNGREIAYGTLISKEGYVLSKASEIDRASTVDIRIDDQFFPKTAVLLTDETWDLVLFKVEGKNLEPARWASSSDLKVGSWVVVNGATSRKFRRILVGIISAKPREILDGEIQALGLNLKSHPKGLQVSRMKKNGISELAGLKVGDVILHISGKKHGKVEELLSFLNEQEIGVELKVIILREGREILLDVPYFSLPEEASAISGNDQMSGDTSKRRNGFPRVIQHDVLASAQTMGGPVLDAQGDLIGMNLARANRAETFAIPVEELRSISAELLRRVENFEQTD